MFDVSYAVQRITEEKSRRKNNYTLSNAFGHPLNMDLGDDADQALINKRLRNSQHQDNDIDALRTQMENTTLIPPSTTTTSSPINNGHTTPSFELSMHNATIIGRRRNTATTTTITTTATATADPPSAGSGIHQ